MGLNFAGYLCNTSQHLPLMKHKVATMQINGGSGNLIPVPVVCSLMHMPGNIVWGRSFLCRAIGVRHHARQRKDRYGTGKHKHRDTAQKHEGPLNRHTLALRLPPCNSIIGYQQGRSEDESQ